MKGHRTPRLVEEPVLSKDFTCLRPCCQLTIPVHPRLSQHGLLSLCLKPPSCECSHSSMTLPFIGLEQLDQKLLRTVLAIYIFRCFLGVVNAQVL